MHYRALTIAREYGSGGSLIAREVAARLGWKLLDNALVLEAARLANVDPTLVRQFDEKPDSWLHRVAVRSLYHGALEAVVSPEPSSLFDAALLARLGASIAREAYAQGNCVVVGRGAQCVLQDQADVFHVFVYGPPAEKAARLKARFPSIKDFPAAMEAMDRCRAAFVKTYFQAQWNDPHLYHLLISSALGIEVAATTIISAMQAGKTQGQ
jgi:cytidylate kinase